MRKLFNNDQEKYIIDNLGKISYLEMSKELNVTYTQLNGWVNNHCKGKKDGRTSYSIDDEMFIRNNFDKMTYDELGRHLKRKGTAVKAKAESMGLRKLREFNDEYFKEINNPLKAYFLGFIYADGWVVKNVKQRNFEFGLEIQNCDKYLLEFLNKELGNQHIIKHRQRQISFNNYNYTNDCYSLRVYSRRIVEDLIRHGIVQNKTLSNIYPKQNHYFNDFLRGFLDGDGCLHFLKNKKSIIVSFTNSNQDFLNYLNLQIYKHIGIEGIVYKEKDRKYRLIYSKKDYVLKLLDFIYKDNSFCLERKYNIYKDWLSSLVIKK